MQVRQGRQVPNVSTLEGDLQAAAHDCVSGIKIDLACIISRTLMGLPRQAHLLLLSARFTSALWHPGQTVAAWP